MNDADAQLVARFAGDLERVLGAGILIEDLDLEGDGPVIIRVACLVDGRSFEISAKGETVVEAMSEAIRQAAEVRLSAAFWQMMGPG